MVQNSQTIKLKSVVYGKKKAQKNILCSIYVESEN